MKTAILSDIPEAIKDYKAGKMLIVIDDEDRENEGDLVLRGSSPDQNAAPPQGS